MQPSVSQRDPVEELAAEFVERCRQGDQPSVADYVAAYPQWAEEIKDLFPTIAALEKVKVASHRAADAHKLQDPAPTRLGDYLILREIGRGGMGIVYEAEQQSLGRRVAVKVLPQHSMLNPSRLARFEKEARTAARLHHTSIVPVFGVGQHEGLHYFVMQYIQGVGLDRIVHELARTRQAAAGGRSAGSDQQDFDVRTSASIVAEALLAGSYVQARTDSNVAGPRRPASQSPVPPPVAAQAGAPTQSMIDLQHAIDTKTAAPPLVPSPKPPVIRRAKSMPRLGAHYWRSVGEIGAQLADALRYAHHQGTLHRDIKPANVMLDFEGNAWLTDFGLAKAMEGDDATTTGNIMGTLRYMAPEQFRGEADARSDTYSLGVTLYEMVTLGPAFESDGARSIVEQITTGTLTPPRKINAEIPQDLETIILKATNRNPAERYQSAAAMATDLQNFLADRPILARRASAAERLRKWAKRNPAVAALTGVAAALLVLVAVIASTGYVKAQSDKRKIETALAGQTQERQRAEANSELALDVLDRIYKHFAPSDLDRESEFTIEGSDGDDITVAVQPALSKETAAVLEELLQFYDRLAAQEGPSEHLRRETARANRRVGDIRSRIGQADEAKQAYQRALASFNQLAVENPDDYRIQLEIARIRTALGTLHRAADEDELADESFEASLAILNSAPKDSPASAEAQYELAQTYYLLGRRGPPRPDDDRGRPPRPPHGGPPEEDFAEHIPHRRPPLGPEDHDAELGPPPPHLAGVGPPDPLDPPGPDGPRGGPEPGPLQREQDRNLTKAAELLEGLVADFPNEPEYRRLLACCYRELTPPNLDVGHEDDHPLEAKAIEMLTALVRDFPDSPDFRYELAETLSRFDVRRDALRSKDMPEAKRRLKLALDHAQQLVESNPGVPDYEFLLAHVRFKLGTVLMDESSDNDAEAEANFRKAIGDATRLADTSAANGAWLAVMQQGLARLLDQQGRFGEAAELLEKSIERLEKIDSAGQRRGPPVGRLLARSYRMLAGAYQELGKPQESEAAHRTAEDLDRMEDQRRPGPPHDRGRRPPLD